MTFQNIQFKERSGLEYLPNDDIVFKIESLGDILSSLLAVVAFLFGGIENICYKLSNKPIPFWFPSIIKYVLILSFGVYIFFSVKVVSNKNYHAFSRTTRYSGALATFIILAVVTYNLGSSLFLPSPILRPVIAAVKWETWNTLETDKNSRVYEAQIKVPEDYKTKYKYSSISISLTPRSGFQLGKKYITPPTVVDAEEKYYFTKDTDTLVRVYFDKFDNSKEWFFKIRIHRKSKTQNWPSLPFEAKLELRRG